ncbi:uncharacterized protein B0I36DRAFT_428859 [Microdochium trichocladiopsis]|uniref:Uncharacterized protein n=1 Tax=Microdochium trichocladiopsis TaxID=1682393 RepID=A0A9P8YCX6_9PEZI|nr:uncharacterized protein B0I36DRAFT_428859 [Microdochium trichocladiopsis]KAH7034512.1 hypothetical protein B0I36DRAFT_428859 [Microdochium trichocladiopsis]
MCVRQPSLTRPCPWPDHAALFVLRLFVTSAPNSSPVGRAVTKESKGKESKGKHRKGKESKGKESKGKDRKGKDSKRSKLLFTSPEADLEAHNLVTVPACRLTGIHKSLSQPILLNLDSATLLATSLSCARA